MTEPRQSLTEFAAANNLTRGKAAWLEGIPEKDEIVAGWQAGMTVGQIRKWLVDVCEYDPQDATISRLQRLSVNYPRDSARD
ncbi:hypothetical protein UFOVP1305_33 [uncultured Caudovirales phage]|uniref:Uncharacterized protein n=1 Tax=uncultured Caudovirales phage TaxID=2100421 RepID=A0A6J5PE05_9CAUD|nr:hypothetical protein UFOVP896_71 [uncultured Caudovirales phage]CAB4197785.1 hypothetical protein UFOVP1305_33 [uncultured Caudovirales phage]